VNGIPVTLSYKEEGKMAWYGQPSQKREYRGVLIKLTRWQGSDAGPLVVVGTKKAFVLYSVKMRIYLGFVGWK
jgi:hypothetical protein